MEVVAIPFFLVLSIVLGAYWAFVVRPEQVAERAVRARLKVQRKQNLRDTLVKARERMSGIGSLDATLARTGTALEPLSDLLTRSGLKMTVGTLLLACIFSALVAMAVVSRFVRSGLAMLGAGVVAAFIPFWIVKRIAAK